MSTISPIVGDINGKWNRTSCWILNMLYVCRIYHQYIHVFFIVFHPPSEHFLNRLSLTFVAVADLFCFNIGDPNRQPTLFYSLLFLPVASLPMFVELNSPLILRPFLGWCLPICYTEYPPWSHIFLILSVWRLHITHLWLIIVCWRITLKKKQLFLQHYFSVVLSIFLCNMAINQIQVISIYPRTYYTMVNFDRQ